MYYYPGTEDFVLEETTRLLTTFLQLLFMAPQILWEEERLVPRFLAPPTLPEEGLSALLLEEVEGRWRAPSFPGLRTQPRTLRSDLRAPGPGSCPLCQPKSWISSKLSRK